MSFTITTDVFCDFCTAWEFGCCSYKADKKQARENAGAHGWKVIIVKDKKKDICPVCYEKEEWLK